MATWNGSSYTLENYSISGLTAAVSGINTSVNFKVQSTSSFTVEVSNGTVSIGNQSGLNLNIISPTIDGFLKINRPIKGLIYPRSICNKYIK